MKRYLLLFALLLASMFSGVAQIMRIPKYKPVANPKLTAADREKFILSVDQIKIRPYDSVYTDYKSKQNKNGHYLSIPVKLTNTSVDTLKYMTMSCSWFEFYCTDNNDINPVVWGCDKNVPHLLLLAPHQSNTIQVAFYISENRGKENDLRIGMILKIVKSNSDFFSFNQTRKDKQDVIWSNPITIPAR